MREPARRDYSAGIHVFHRRHIRQVALVVLQDVGNVVDVQFERLEILLQVGKAFTFSSILSYCESATKTIPSTPRSTSWRVVL